MIKLASGCIISIILVGCTEQTDLINEVSQLKKDYQTLRQQYTDLQTRFDALQKENKILAEKLKRYQESSKILYGQ